MWMQMRKKHWLCAILGSILVTVFFGQTILHWIYLKMVETRFSEQSFDYPLNVDFSFVYNPSMPRPNVKLNEANFSFLHSPTDWCRGEADLGLVLVKSSVSNVFHRRIIRATYFTELASRGLRGAFLIGQSLEFPASLIDEEAKQHNDIIQYDYIDHYYNNTYKMMAGFQWQRKFCKNFQYLVMCDDDYFVNVPNLQRYLQRVGPKDFNRFVTGYVFSDSQPDRSLKAKWYISLDEYRWSRWPPYPTGGFYIVSKPTADYISEAMSYVRYLRFDDVFLGIVLWKLKIEPVHDENFMFAPPVFVKSYFQIVAAHTYGQPLLLDKIWNLIRKVKDHE